MNIKVKQTENLDGRIVTRGKLVLIETKEVADILKWKKDSKITGRAIQYIQADVNYIRPIIISETEEILIGDSYLQILTSGKKCVNVADEITVEIIKEQIVCEVFKILALPEHFSPEILQMIVDGDLKDGQDLWVECEEKPEIIAKFGIDFKDEYVIKLINNHINIFPI